MASPGKKTVSLPLAASECCVIVMSAASSSIVSRASTPTTLDNTLGALLIGGLMNMAYVPSLLFRLGFRSNWVHSLWGVTCVQTYNYFTHIKNRDRVSLKLMVLFLISCSFV